MSLFIRQIATCIHITVCYAWLFLGIFQAGQLEEGFSGSRAIPAGGPDIARDAEAAVQPGAAESRLKRECRLAQVLPRVTYSVFTV